MRTLTRFIRGNIIPLLLIFITFFFTGFLLAQDSTATGTGGAAGIGNIISSSLLTVAMTLGGGVTILVEFVKDIFKITSAGSKRVIAAISSLVVVGLTKYIGATAVFTIIGQLGEVGDAPTDIVVGASWTYWIVLAVLTWGFSLGWFKALQKISKRE